MTYVNKQHGVQAVLVIVAIGELIASANRGPGDYEPVRFNSHSGSR